MTASDERRERALVLLKADPSLARRELQRRKDKRAAKARQEPPPPIVDESFVVLGTDDLKAFLDG